MSDGEAMDRLTSWRRAVQLRRVLSTAERRADLANAWTAILSALGYDLLDPHLAESPARVARFLDEWHTNLAEPPAVTKFPANGYDEMIVVSGIRFSSLCAHHGLPFVGEGAIGYVPSPDGQIAGLSKLARVLDHFARRFQSQEQLGIDVADCLGAALAPVGIGVVLRAEHLCMAMRGIQRPGHFTTTSVMRGCFRDRPEARAELLALIGATK